MSSKKKKVDIRQKNISFMDITEYNLATLNDYYNRLKRICLVMFEWENLPKSMNSRFLEYCFFEYGSAGAYYNKKLGFVNSMVSWDGQVNQYMLPSRFRLYSVGNIWNESRRLFIEKNDKSLEEEAVFMMNNFDALPTKPSIELFAHRLAKAEKTLDINLNALKTPLVLTTENEGQVLSLQNLWFKYDGNSPIIIGNGKLINADSIKAIKTDAPVLLDQISKYKEKIWNEALQFFGINSIDSDKKERLIIDEVNSNNEVTNLNLQTYLSQRQEACRQLNEFIGLEGDKQIKVRVRSDLKNIIKQSLSVSNDFTPNLQTEGGEVNE